MQRFPLHSFSSPLHFSPHSQESLPFISLCTGVSKKIRVYEYASVVGEKTVELHVPIITMNCRTKIR